MQGVELLRQVMRIGVPLGQSSPDMNITGLNSDVASAQLPELSRAGNQR